MNKIGLVIARFHENLNWIKNINIPIDIYVYNRHKDKSDTGGINTNNIPSNINLEIINMEDDEGYEASVYAYHCYFKHDVLNDFTIFSQAEPHLGGWSHDASPYINDPNLLHTHYVGTANSEGIFSSKVEIIEKEIEFEWISECWVWRHIHNCHCWYPWKNDFSKRPTNKFCSCKTLPSGELEIQGVNKGFGWNWGAGSHFIVSKSRILNHPADYYKCLQEFCINYIDEFPLPDAIWPNAKNIRGGHAGELLMESTWEFIF